jgi:hypothetical protein
MCLYRLGDGTSVRGPGFHALLGRDALPGNFTFCKGCDDVVTFEPSEPPRTRTWNLEIRRTLRPPREILVGPKRAPYGRLIAVVEYRFDQWALSGALLAE